MTEEGRADDPRARFQALLADLEAGKRARAVAFSVARSRGASVDDARHASTLSLAQDGGEASGPDPELVRWQLSEHLVERCVEHDIDPGLLIRILRSVEE